MAIYSDRESVFGYFEEITKIPRNTGDEKAIGDFIFECNKKRCHEIVKDEYGNILIYVEATEGYEDEAPITLHSNGRTKCGASSYSVGPLPCSGRKCWRKSRLTLPSPQQVKG